MSKTRIDILVSEKLNISRAKAKAVIMAGQVFIDTKTVDKPGTEVDEQSKIEIKKLFPYVSRGALKLEKAAKEFDICFDGKTVCDIGSSTGGFTDYALQNGAREVYAVDIGKGQLAQKIREDKRVTVMEQIDIRNVKGLPDKIDIFTCDVSFISLKKILPELKRIEREPFEAIVLIKPQFEVGKKVADKFRGVIKDKKIQGEVVGNIKEYAKELGYEILGVTESPIKGAKGNREFLIYLKS